VNSAGGITTPCSRPRIAQLSCARRLSSRVECAAADGGRYALHIMTISARIDDDCKSLTRYFQRLFELLREATAEDQVAPFEAVDMTALESQSTYHRISHLIKPDMLINIYGLVDFWLKEICKYQRRKNNLSLSYSDIKGNDDLHACHKYLTKYAGLNLTPVNVSYARLQELRVVRNQLIHHGGHLPDDDRLIKRISAINGIALAGSLMVIDESFIWDVLACAKLYLCTAAQA
jgi:hypothetical protein